MDLRSLPAIHELLADPRLLALPRPLALRCARAAVDQARQELRAGGSAPPDLAQVALALAQAARAPHLRPVVNATGIPIHTNLGRAPLAPEAAEAVAQVARGYCNVELDLESGRRGGRLAGVAGPLRALCGAEDAVAVNNNAAAVLLVLTALARGRAVVVSRGELVEIGGSFRVPEVISAGGARLVEVGATNRTRVADYAGAIDEQTALLLRVHPSNFRMEGFTERPDRVGLVALARQRAVPLVEDLGSGLLGALPGGVQGEEEPVDAVLGAGVDLVCFSGDKLLGGPQAGIIAGRADLVAACRQHPLYRALRLDKLVLAALEATLRLYLEGRADEVPVRAMLARGPAECQAVARRLAAALPGARVEDDVGYSGGGALPARGLPTRVLALPVPDPDALARRLRLGAPAVVARVARDALIIDPRTLLFGDEARLLQALAAAGVPVRGERGAAMPEDGDDPARAG
ncbi:L-seryl-tRNA(Sec) selenium transferase [Myxococcota bacterium]|nr:L-seryl-tRNA(Sec) selenium transferase [Myxococcota bacterium]